MQNPGLLQQWLSDHLFTPLAGGGFWLALAALIAAFFLALGVMHQLPTPVRRRVMVLCTFVAGLFYAVEFFWPKGGWLYGQGDFKDPTREQRPAVVAATVLTNLHEGRLSPALRRPFQGAHALPDDAILTTEIAGERWRIESGDHSYLIRAGVRLEVLRDTFLFDLDDLGLLNDLNSDTLSADLRTEFQNRGLDLSPAAVLSTENPGREWKITDGDTEYKVRGGPVINIYEAGNPANPLTGYKVPLGTFIAVMFGFTWGLGIISLSMVHGRQVRRRQAGWGNSIAFFVAMIGTAFIGFGGHFTRPLEPAAGEDAPRLADMLWDFCTQGMMFPLGATMFSLLAFYIVSAAYRAFRVRSLESGLMMFTAVIIMLGQVPLGLLLTNWIPTDSFLGFLRLERLAGGVLTGINAAALRAVLFGSTMGYLAIALRTWLSLERGAYFGQED